MDISSLTTAGRINYKSITEARPVYEQFRQMSEDPAAVQYDFLMKLLADNKDTEYGKKYGFADIRSPEEYRQRVPVSLYDDYAPYIGRMVNQNETNLITAYPVGHFNKTSGTLGTPKKIPMSDPAVAIFNKYNGAYLYALRERELGLDWINGRGLHLVEGVESMPVLKNGATFGALSWKSMAGARPYLPLMMTSPDEAIFPAPDTNTRYLHARFGLAEDTITSLGASFSSFLYELLRYIQKNWELLVHDIGQGTIDPGIQMRPDVREALLKKIQPLPERARQLQEIFSRGFGEPFVPKVWPSLCYVSSVATGGFREYADKMKAAYLGDQIRYCKIGLNASEGTFSVPAAMDSEDSLFLPDSLFYEFLPLDAGDDFSEIVTLDRLETGKAYELIITNLSGFYRYRMRDAVMITGKWNQLPMMQYLYRADSTISLMGEKTTEQALRFSVEQTAEELGFVNTGYSVYPDTEASPPRYQYFMEAGDFPPGLNPKIIRRTLEKNLALANPSMGDKMKRGICGNVRVNFLEPESYLLYEDIMVYKGAARSQLKPVTIIRNERQRRFFFSQTEYSSELMK